MVLVVHSAHAPQARERFCVANPAAERVAGIGRIRDQASGAHDVGGLAQQTALGIDRMDEEVLRHGLCAGSQEFFDQLRDPLGLIVMQHVPGIRYGHVLQVAKRAAPRRVLLGR